MLRVKEERIIILVNRGKGKGSGKTISNEKVRKRDSVICDGKNKMV